MTDLTATASVTRRLIRQRDDHDLHLGVHLVAGAAPSHDDVPRPALNIALVLDRSGSMTGRKIAFAREAAIFAVQQLASDDRVGVVAYDEIIEIVAPSQPATPSARQSAKAALGGIRERGSTNLHGGWVAGLQQIASQQGAAASSALHRCFLLTDGLANVGETRPAALAAIAAEWRARGVTTTTFGVGADFDETLLAALAEAGGGHFHFIAEPADIPNFFKGELGELQTVMARDIALELRAIVERPAGTEHATFTLLNKLPLTVSDDGTARATLGDLYAEGELQIVAQVACPHGARGETMTLHARITYNDAQGRPAPAIDLPALTVTYDLDAAVDAAPVDETLTKAVLLMRAAHAREEAALLDDQGNYAGSAHAYGAALQAMRASPYADDDTDAAFLGEMLALDALQAEAGLGPMAPMAKKLSRSQAYQRRHTQRDYSGQPPNIPPAPPQGQPPQTPPPGAPEPHEEP